MPKEGIHPKYDKITVKCACGTHFETRSTHKGDIVARNLLCLPPVLYGQAEADRYGRSRGAVPPEVCQVGCGQGRGSREVSGADISQKASACAGAFCLRFEVRVRGFFNEEALHTRTEAVGRSGGACDAGAGACAGELLDREGGDCAGDGAGADGGGDGYGVSAVYQECEPVFGCG